MNKEKLKEAATKLIEDNKEKELVIKITRQGNAHIIKKWSKEDNNWVNNE